MAFIVLTVKVGDHFDLLIALIYQLGHCFKIQHVIVVSF